MAEVPEHTLHNLQDLQTDAGRMLEGVTLLPKITQSATAYWDEAETLQICSGMNPVLARKNTCSLHPAGRQRKSVQRVFRFESRSARKLPFQLPEVSIR